MKKILYLLLLIVGITSCNHENNNDYTPIHLEVPSPINFSERVYDTDLNPVTQAGFELGKELFYDGKLSVNNAISCAFCHEQAFAFTHHGHNLSHGVNGGIGFRNTPPIQNMGYQSIFMWDGAASHLDLMPIIPITSDIEMGETLDNVIEKLRHDPYYVNQFNKAFYPDGDVNTENMLKALSQFMVMMVSYNSKYDKFIRNEDGINLTYDEQEGLNIFRNKCASCHATDLFTDQSYRNTGLPVHHQLQDKGRFNILNNPSDLYKFRVPSLRNIEVTYPYMHDGRFFTLESVLDFYTNGMVDNGNVDQSLLRSNGTYGIDLSNTEKQQIIAFLKTLTDTEFLNDPRFAEY